ncbi:MAG: tetratricopeptide repeat protein [Bacteroidales bacterium]|nr:MAG: tetratricopeptide repeat protein [Bacteroidales bacterium]
MNVSRGVIITILWIFFIKFVPLSAQRPNAFVHIDTDYKRGLELFEKQKYGAAQKHFREAINSYDGYDTELKTDAEFHDALCAVNLFNEDAGLLITQFIENHPESPKTNLARFELARFQFQKNSYRRAVQCFEKVDRLRLPDELLAEYHFKSGYSYFMTGELERASLAFYEIKDINSAYTAPAIYYYAHIAYDEKNYETALKEFRRLTDDENFSPIVPFYIVQILYLQKKYDEIIDVAPPLLESATPQRALEIEKFIGDAYYQKSEFGQAIPHLEKYAAESRSLTREDRYQLGYAYHQAGEFDKAATRFEQATRGNDLLSQHSYYLLADCYLKSGNKDGARVAFSSASKMDFDESIKEDALFNFAKITYELSYSPFNEAIRALIEYIDLYPYSDRIDEAYEFLMQAYLNTRNYKDALESLTKIQEKSDRIKFAYQRVAFYRGLELFSDLKLEEAIDHFDLSLQYSEFDQTIKARSWYWRGEAYYRLQDYDMALEDYQVFLVSPGAFELDEYKSANYNMGYVFFKAGDYPEASGWFRKYENLAVNDPSKILADAYNRIGDCYFIASDYQAANTYYQKVIDLNVFGVDYAMFQKGFSLGILNRHTEKIRLLTQLQENLPESPYVDDALFERGRSYVTLEEDDRAIRDYQKIIDDFSNSSYVPKAMVQLALVYYDMNRYEDAIEGFKKVIEGFRGTEEAKNALTGLRNVYVALNEVDDYFSYVKGLGEDIRISLSEQDSLRYAAGENLYMTGNCERALRALDSYIRDFQNGSFILNAHFYKAECELKMGNEEEALLSYNFVIRNPRSLFTEPSLAAAADINFRSGKYNDAIEDYIYLENIAELPDNILTARLGLMRCFYLRNNYNNTIESAGKVLISDKISEEEAREAYFKIAKSYYELGQLEEARTNFKRIASEVKSLEGAESKYRVAEICYLLEQYDEAEQQIIEFLDLSTPHPYWMAKMFILDADIKVTQQDYFQAKHTLQAVIDYYENRDDGIIKEASEKLNEINTLEQFLNPPVESDSITNRTDREPADKL